MLRVLESFEGTQSHRLVENQEHVRRILDLVLGSTFFDAFLTVLQWQETEQTVNLKIYTLKCIKYLTIGAKYLTSANGL